MISYVKQNNIHFRWCILDIIRICYLKGITIKSIKFPRVLLSENSQSHFLRKCMPFISVLLPYGLHLFIYKTHENINVLFYRMPITRKEYVEYTHLINIRKLMSEFIVHTKTISFLLLDVMIILNFCYFLNFVYLYDILKFICILSLI